MSNKRFSVSECVKIYNEKELLAIGAAADEMRRRIHKDKSDTVTFVADRNVTYTNICDCKCKFCAFFRSKNHAECFVLPFDEMMRKIDELAKLGGTQIMLQGGLNPALKLDFYVKMLKMIKEKHKKLTLHSLSPPEIDHIARVSNKSVPYVLATLQEAGLDSLPGGGGEILINRIRKAISPNKMSSERWLQIMREAHRIGMRSTATMVFGFGETLEERFKSMEKVRRLQDETGGFRAFIPWPFSPARTKLSTMDQPDGVAYLKTLPISRLLFDNIKNIHSGWVTEGMKLAQLALVFGANDLGGILMEEKVVRSTGLINDANVKEFYEAASGAGFRLARRNTNYDILEYIKFPAK